jgi:sulfotransferase family protein
MKVRLLLSLAGVAISFAVPALMAQDAMKTVMADEVVWKDDPVLPKGGQTAVLIGDPSKAETIVLRVKFDLAARKLGLRANIEAVPDGLLTDVIFRARFQRDAAFAAETPLFEQIRLRVTNRKLGQRQPLTLAAKTALQEVARSSDAELSFLTESSALEQVGEAIARCDRFIFLNQQTHREMIGEIRWNPEQVLSTRDGIDIASLHLPAADAAVMQLLTDWAPLSYLRQIKCGQGIPDSNVAINGQHPHAYVTPGLNLQVRQTIRDLLEYRRDAYQTIDGLLRTIAQLLAGEQTMDSIDMAKRWLRRRKSDSCADVMKELCEKVSPSRLIDRWLFHARDADLLPKASSAFSKAQFLHLTRHPVEQGMAILQSVEGIADLWNEKSLDRSARLPALDPQYSWFNTHAAILEFRETLPPKRYLQIRIEEVTANPKDCFRKLCDWLELPQGMAIRARHWPFAAPGPYNAPGGIEWEPALDAEQLPDCSRSLNESLPWMKKKVGLAEPVKILAQALCY